MTTAIAARLLGILEGSEKLNYLTGRLGDEIAALRGKRASFAPHWEAPDRVAHALKRDVPLWVIASVFALFGLLAFLGTRGMLERQTIADLAPHTHEGGVKVNAANGPLSLRAHTDELQILADKDVTVISVNDEIRISASTKIEPIAGQSSITLDGANIEFKTPGAFTVKGSGHAFLGGSSGAAEMTALPDAKVKLFDERFQLLDAEGAPLAGIP